MEDSKRREKGRKWGGKRSQRQAQSTVTKLQKVVEEARRPATTSHNYSAIGYQSGVYTDTTTSNVSQDTLVS